MSRAWQRGRWGHCSSAGSPTRQGPTRLPGPGNERCWLQYDPLTTGQPCGGHPIIQQYRYTPRCLDALATQSPPPREIIVVDSSPEFPLASYRRPPAARLSRSLRAFAASESTVHYRLPVLPGWRGGWPQRSQQTGVAQQRRCGASVMRREVPYRPAGGRLPCISDPGGDNHSAGPFRLAVIPSAGARI